MAALLMWLSLAMGWPTSALLSAPPPSPKERQEAAISSDAFPADVQLLKADTDPTLRIPIAHFTQTMLAGPFSRISGGFGWFEISRSTVRYAAAAPLNVGHYGSATKETDIGFEYARSEITELKMLHHSIAYPIPDGAVQAHIQEKLRHYFAYYAYVHWPLDRKSMDKMQKVDAVYTPLILQAFQNFDAVVAEFKLRHQAAAPPPVAAPVPAPAPPSSPEVVIVAPSGASANGTVQANESPLTIRGVAMDNAGLPTVTINGAPAALRPKDAHAVEFWSEPLPLKPGDNPVQITATNSAQAEAKLAFTIHYTPKTAPLDSRALDKADIISLLAGGVPAPRVVQLVKDRGIKFAPTADDLKIIRAAGGTDDLIEAIRQAAPHP